MMFAHLKNIIHRNLNIENIFIDSEKHVKISNFGISNFLKQSEQIKIINKKIFCLSKELLQNDEYDEKVDVFAFGMIMLFILNRGKGTFLTREDILLGKKAVIPNKINKISYSIVSKCLSHSKEDRPSFKAILSTIKRWNFKLIDGIDSKIDLIEDHLKPILDMKKPKTVKYKI